jgi:hypothetical protein
MNRRAVSALLVGILCAIPAGAGAMRVLPVNLEGLVEGAGVIFDGTCLSVDYKTDEQGILATYTTFEVHRPWKGEVPQTITIKTYGGRQGSLITVVPGLPTFSPGQRVLLFLNPASKIGFTSPVGMGQGSFKIFTGPDGGEKVVNEDNNRNLFRDIDWERLEGSADQTAVRQLRMRGESPSGPVDYDVLKSLVDTIARRPRP